MTGMDRAKIENFAESLMHETLDLFMRKGYYAFRVFLFTQDGDMQVAHLPTGFPGGQGALGDFLRAKAATGKYELIAIVSESWTLRAEEGKKLPLTLTMPISEHPDRKECVQVQLCSRHGELTLQAFFDRDDNGKPIRPSSVEKEWQPVEGAGGRLQGIFAGV